MRSHIKAGIAASLATALTIPGFARAQSTVFTYQGRLKNGAAPATGLYDFRFRLFDAASAGAQVGTTQCADNVTVTEGLFTAPIDFGQQFATTGQRFLEVEVRADSGLDCLTLTGFVVLTPRQPLTVAPIAAHARSAFTLAAADGSPANAVFVDNAGKVGVGTLAPTHTVHIATPEPTIALQDTNSSVDQVGYVDYRDSGNFTRGWVGYGTAGSPHFSVVNARLGGDVVLMPFSGRVRLGSSGQYFAPGGEEPLRIIRGRVAANGVVLGGTGFRVSHPFTGIYTITFNSPFTTIPSVTATNDWAGGAPKVMVVGGATTGDVTLEMFNNTSGSAPADDDFHFIAIGTQ